MDPNDEKNKNLGHPEVVEYGDEGIASKDAPIPRWLKFNYLFWPLWGLVAFYYFWNGSVGWFDRGYWNQLQRAAGTVYPFNTLDIVEESKK